MKLKKRKIEDRLSRVPSAVKQVYVKFTTSGRRCTVTCWRWNDRA